MEKIDETLEKKFKVNEIKRDQMLDKVKTCLIFFIMLIGIWGLANNSMKSIEYKNFRNLQQLKQQFGERCDELFIIQKESLLSNNYKNVIETKEVQKWLSRKKIHDELTKTFQQGKGKCALIKEQDMKPKFLTYIFVRHFIIEKSKNQTEMQKALDFKPIQQLSKQNQGTKQTINDKQYFIIQLQKPITASTDGFYDGKKPDDLEKNHQTFTVLSQRLIQFYTQENATSIVDFGCGRCEYVKNLREAGFNASGFDGVAKVLNLVQPQDLGQFDWVQSFEVGEHIPPNKTNIFLSNLLDHAKKGIIISWAIRGQAGFRHINRKNNAEVIKLIEPYGFKFDKNASIAMRTDPSLKWFRTNLMIFRKVSK